MHQVLNHNLRMSSRWTGFFIWVLVAACAAFWGIKIFAATRPVPAGALAPQVAIATSGPMVRLFGAVVVAEEPEDAAPAASERFQLVGVIAPRSGDSGMALLTVDGQPAKAWHVGATIDGDTTLLSVVKRGAEFGPRGGPAAFTLELPAPAAPETGTLPAAVSQPNAGMQAPQTAQQMIQTPGVPIPGAVRGGTPPAGFVRGGMPLRPGMIPPNVVPPGRTVPTQGQAQVQPTDGAVHPDEE